MMERIGDHLTYLAKYAASSQSSEEVQKVHLIIAIQSDPSISITSGPGPSMLIEGLCI